MRRFLLPGLTGLLLTCGLHVPAAGETLADALREAYAHNPRLDAERARLRATDELVPQALAGWRPLIRATGSVGIDRETQDGVHAADRFPPADSENNRNSRALEQIDGRLIGQQSLYSGGETVAGTRRAENQVRSARARLTDAEQEVLLDVVDAYASVVRARNTLGLSRDNLDRLDRFLGGTRERFAVAELTRTDVAQAESRVSGAIADLARSESELETALADYERNVGDMPGDLAPVGPLAELPATLDEALSLLPRHPRIVQASFDLEAARDQIRVDEAQLLPEVNLIGELSRRRQPSPNLQSLENASIGAEIVVPLYQRGTEYSRVRQSKQTAIQRRYDLTDIERAVRREVIASFEALDAARRQITALDNQVRTAREALEGTREEAIAGARTVLDVLNAELELFTAQTRRERALEQEVVASYRLQSAIGGLTLAGLGMEDQGYDPEANYRQVRNRWFGLAVEEPGTTPR
jgi:TolC family type I secretion outer membrane protein